MDESPAKMYALTSAMLMLALPPVAFRFYVRTRQIQGLGADDWLIIIATIGAIGIAAATYVATALGGLGGHTQISSEGWPIYTPQMAIYLQANFATLLTQTISFGFTKLSVLFFYRRLFSPNRIFNIVSWSMIGLVILWTIAFFCVQLLQCLPISANWSGPASEGANCVNTQAMFIAGSWSDAIIDALITMMPIPMIWRLQMSAQRKIALCGVFLLGALTVLSSVSRLIIYHIIESQMDAGDMDEAYIIAPTFYWPMIESSLGILGACLPILRPLFKRSVSQTPKSDQRGFTILTSTSVAVSKENCVQDHSTVGIFVA